MSRDAAEEPASVQPHSNALLADWNRCHQGNLALLSIFKLWQKKTSLCGKQQMYQQRLRSSLFFSHQICPHSTGRGLCWKSGVLIAVFDSVSREELQCRLSSEAAIDQHSVGPRLSSEIHTSSRGELGLASTNAHCRVCSVWLIILSKACLPWRQWLEQGPALRSVMLKDRTSALLQAASMRLQSNSGTRVLLWPFTCKRPMRQQQCHR